MKKLGLIGFPLSHSFSKKYFEKKFKNEGINNYTYQNYELPSIDDFKTLLTEQSDLIGLNVTIPYKEKILKYVDLKDEIVKATGAANTLKLLNGKIYAYNTDVYGFKKSFLEKLKSSHKKALILGTGGASKSVAFVLKELSIPFLFVSRNPINSQMICYEDLNKNILHEHQIIINTTPLGTSPNIETFPPIPYEFIDNRHYFYDLVYNPSKTLFLKKAEEKGAAIHNGLKMLELQAEQAWRIWTDKY